MCAPSISIPQSLSYHSWKFPLADRQEPAARTEISAASRANAGTSELSWKSHLASAQMSDLATQLSDLIFLEDAADAEVSLSKPSILSRGAGSAGPVGTATLSRPVGATSPGAIEPEPAYAKAA